MRKNTMKDQTSSGHIMFIPAAGTCFPYTSRRRTNRLFFCITFCLSDSFDDLIFKLGSDTNQQQQHNALPLFTAS